MQFALEILGFKETDWLRVFWAIIREPDFSKEYSFCNIKKHIMIITLGQKTLNQWTGYLAKTTKALILGYF